MKITYELQEPDWDMMEEGYKEKQSEILFRSMLKMKELAVARVPVTFGHLKESLEVYPIAKGQREYTLQDGVDYGIDVEYGTAPHHVKIEPLKLWAKRKLGDEDAAYWVQKKIAKKGTHEQPFFRPALDEVHNTWLPKISRDVLSE